MLNESPQIDGKHLHRWLHRREWDGAVCDHCQRLVEYLYNEFDSEVLAIGSNNPKAEEIIVYVSVALDEPLLGVVGRRFQKLIVTKDGAVVRRACYCAVESAG